MSSTGDTRSRQVGMTTFMLAVGDGRPNSADRSCSFTWTRRNTARSTPVEQFTTPRSRAQRRFPDWSIHVLETCFGRRSFREPLLDAGHQAFQVRFGHWVIRPSLGIRLLRGFRERRRWLCLAQRTSARVGTAGAGLSGWARLGLGTVLARRTSRCVGAVFSRGARLGQRAVFTSRARAGRRMDQG